MQNMSKALKLRLSFLSNIQLCRSKDPSCLIQNPVASKVFHISLPSFTDPPPSPYHSLTKNNLESSKSREYSKTMKAGQEKKCSPRLSSDSNERACLVAPSRIQKKKEKTTTKKPKAKVNTSMSIGNNDETHSLFSSPPSFNSSHGLDNQPRSSITDEEEPLNGSKKPEKQRSIKTGRFQRYGSKDWKDGSMTALENKSWEQKHVSQRVMSRNMDKRVNQSFVVVKRSVDPYEDFKKSMLEMILEKQMYEPKELEQLLMSFLSLNSRLHHKVILEAFIEIWKELFSGSYNLT